MKRYKHFLIPIAVAVPALLLALACDSDAERTGAGPSPPAERKSTEITPGHLLAAALSPDDVEERFFGPEQWWPELPQFNVGIGDEAPGLQFYVVQGYQQVGALSRSRVESALILYEDEEAAKADFSGRLLTENDAGGEPATGANVGDESRYFLREGSREDTPYETTLRFRVGRLTGRISAFHELGYEAESTLTAWAEPVVRRSRQLLAGKLTARALPEAVAEAMPASPPPAIGPLMGEAAVPIESWALVDTSGDPERTRDNLSSLGADTLGFRRYALAADPSNVVETTLFTFADSDNAAEWVSGFLEMAAGLDTLDAGETGPLSAFVSYGDAYELQFAAGNLVADVFCTSPFGDISPACEQAARDLAESWYGSLSPALSGPSRQSTEPSAQGQLSPTSEPSDAPTQPPAAPPADAPAAPQGSTADPAFTGSWRIYSEYIYYDAGGGGGSDSSASGTRRLELYDDGTWTFGPSSGYWSIEPVSPSDWDRWAIPPYGPDRKIVLQGWNGGVESGPVEESGGYVDFVWVIYHVDTPEPGLVYIKFGH